MPIPTYQSRRVAPFIPPAVLSARTGMFLAKFARPDAFRAEFCTPAGTGSVFSGTGLPGLSHPWLGETPSGDC